MTKLRVLVLSFPDFADTSTMHKILDSKGQDNLFQNLCMNYWRLREKGFKFQPI
jgi:hypothetical protein